MTETQRIVLAGPTPLQRVGAALTEVDRRLAELPFAQLADPVSIGMFQILCDLKRAVGALAEHALIESLPKPADDNDEERGTGCCAKDGVDCVSCMTGRCADCRECAHYDDSARDDDGDTAYYDPDED